jgi:hypothetical protein
MATNEEEYARMKTQHLFVFIRVHSWPKRFCFRASQRRLAGLEETRLKPHVPVVIL